MRKSLIFGANGYIGRHITHSLYKQGFKVIPSGKSPTSIDGYSTYIQADITDKMQLKKIDFDVDEIYILSGLTGTDTDKETSAKMHEVNEIGLANILEQHQSSKSKALLIYPSTRLVYKGKTNEFLSEDDEKLPLTPYAVSKLNAEDLLQQYALKTSCNYVIFRICVPYGNLFDRDYSYGTIGFFLRKVKKQQPITLFGKGLQKRTFTHIEDISNIMTSVYPNKNCYNTVFNIGGNDHLSLAEAAELFSKKFGVAIEFIPFPKAAQKVESGDTIFSDKNWQACSPYLYQHHLKTWLNNRTQVIKK